MNGGGHRSIHPHLPLQFTDFLGNMHPLGFRQHRILQLTLQAQQNHLLTVFRTGVFSGANGLCRLLRRLPGGNPPRVRPMTGQEIIVALLVLLAVGYVGLRLLRRRAGNCCGESECPAAKEVTKRLDRVRARRFGRDLFFHGERDEMPFGERGQYPDAAAGGNADRSGQRRGKQPVVQAEPGGLKPESRPA